jgi:glycosyltransferase involved in cell wall biosynthesis
MSGLVGERVLWIAYDGILEGPGRSQVVPYLEAFAARGLRPSLLTWEKPGPRGGSGHGLLAARLRRAGVRWRILPYHRRPTLPATALDLLHGVVAGAGMADVDLVHARSILSALVGRPLARLAGVPWIFDTRGFWADERVDGALWPRDGVLHRVAGRIERRAWRRADGLVVLTERAKRTIRESGATAPLRVIPTCVDTRRFRPGAPPPEVEGLSGRRVYLLLGATGTWYLRDEMLDYGRDALGANPEARLVVLSQHHHEELRAGLAARGILGRTILRSVPHEEVPSWVGACTAAVLFIRPAPSKAASCPTKLGEILACGRPVVVNAGVGDVDDLVRGRRVGVVTDAPGPGAFARTRPELDSLLADPDLPERCRRAAEEDLSLEAGATAYLDLYAEVLSRTGRD